MSTPVDLNISHQQGDTFSKPFKLLNDGVDYDITDWTLAGEIRAAKSATATLIATLTMTKTDASAGEFTASATAAVMAAVSAGTFYYDIQMTHSGGTKTTLWAGKFIVLNQITDD